MSGFFNGYGSLLFLAGVIGFMVWMHSRGHGCCGGHAHGDDKVDAEEKDGALKEPMTENEKTPVKSGGCH